MTDSNINDNPSSSESEQLENSANSESQSKETNGGENNSSAENAGFQMPPDVPLPDPSLITLATSLGTQAMVSMGIFPNPMTGKSEFMLHQAKHLIDTVQLLFDKTTGNRTDEESKMLESIVHELHMLFVAAQNEKNRRDN